VNPVFSSAIDEAVEEALHPPKPEKSRGAAKKHAAAKKAAPEKRARAKKDAPPGRTGDGRGSEAKAEAASGSRSGRGRQRQQKQRSVPPPAVNEPLTFINFVAAFPVGSTIQGEVVSFTSHGAMVDVPLPGGGELHCYIPLTAMGTPPPTKARQVLKKGEVRSFVLAGLDPPRRVAELAIPQAVSAAPKRTAAKKVAPAAKKAPTTKAAPSTKKAAKKAAGPAKKATKATKKAVAAKKAPKKAAAKKAAPKKAAAKKAAKAKKAPAKKSPAKKAGKTRAQ
jgi:hypothetical protein